MIAHGFNINLLYIERSTFVSFVMRKCNSLTCIEYCRILWHKKMAKTVNFKHKNLSTRVHDCFLTCEKDHSSFSYSLSQRATRLIKGKSRKEPQLVREMKLCNNGSRMAKMTIMQGHRRLLKSGPARYSHKSPSTERAQE